MHRLAERAGELGSVEMERLVARCGEGDSAAWDRVLAEVRRLAMDLARWKYRLSREDAEDVAQVVQIRVAERLPQLRERSSFPFWVRRLAHRAAIDSLRSRKSLLSLDDPQAPVLEMEPVAAADDYDQILLRADLDRALSRLPDLYREPVRLTVLEGMPQDEVGRLLGRPRSTVASQVERGLHRLQRCLSPAIATNC